jgi:hypothetical protein
MKRAGKENMEENKACLQFSTLILFADSRAFRRVNVKWWENIHTRNQQNFRRLRMFK